MKKQPSQPELMFRDTVEPVQQLLKNLSMWGYIYIGRTGVGLTTSFRKGRDRGEVTLISSIQNL